MKVFNKVEKDFATVREYNDYLEEVEDISTYQAFFIASSLVVRPRFLTSESNASSFLGMSTNSND